MHPDAILQADEQVVYGPFSTFDGAFIVEIIQPGKNRNASTIVRATYKAGHAINRKGKDADHAPPLHLHMMQSETFHVLSGKIGVTHGYELKDTILTAADGPFEIIPYMPHRPWPVPDCKEDTTILMIATPENVPNPIGGLFFRDIFLYSDDCHVGKAKFDPLQVLLMQHVTDSAPVMFPGAWYLGPARWWIPLRLQGLAAWIAGSMVYSPRLAKYDKAD
ncbi:hypothetical protein C1H76_5484 [Elsinoe australis]|uniref:Cupin 2 conserved barrel domain-containing protein n=1 Tax=Elsinoe australis TaxID=40998 RepID=A0A4U7B103_9PEZI|nr:hypothetical protein C1H76_5484 [Elsinoe australis]